MTDKLRIFCTHDPFAHDPAPRRRLEQYCADWAELKWVPQNEHPDTARATLADCAVAIGWPKPDWLLASSVRFFQCGSTGYESYVGKGLETKPRFTMANSAGTMSIPVAEHGIAMMFAHTRRIDRHARDQTQRRFERQPPYREVWDTTACICGIGGIGTQLARLCRGLGMKVIGVRKDATHAHPLVEKIFPLDRLADAVAEADHVFIAFPLTAETRGIFDRRIFAAMKPGAALYALARGAHYVEADLVAALRSGQVGFAGLDVFTQEPLESTSALWDEPNCLITPHASGRSVREHERFCDLVIANLEAFRAGGPLRNVVMQTA